MDPLSQELELTEDLLEYARAVALQEAPKYCGRRVSYEDVVQEAILHLISKPPKFDPSRGASPKTLIYTIIHRAVMKAAEREARQVRRFRPFPQGDEEDDEPQISENRATELTRSRWSMDDILRFIDSEDSRALCRLVIECGGNLSEAARRMKVSEGTIRYRLKTLAPKLLAAGFDPFATGGET